MQGFGMGDLTDVGKSLTAFLHYWWGFFFFCNQSNPVFGLTGSRGKECQGLFIHNLSGRGKLLIQPNGEWILGQMHCRARWMSCYTSQVDTCLVDCTLRCIACGCHSFPALDSQWNNCSPTLYELPSELQTATKVIGQYCPDRSAGCSWLAW